MPLAAVTGRAELIDAVHPGGLGGTYGGNPVACAAALASIDQMRELDLCGRARTIESTVVGRMNALAKELDVIGDVRGRGAMLAIELVKPGWAGAGRRHHQEDRRRMPRCRRRDPHLRYLRQRHPFAPAAGHLRRAARRRVGPSSRPSSALQHRGTDMSNVSDLLDSVPKGLWLGGKLVPARRPLRSTTRQRVRNSPR